jgi:hypothetical protein
VYVNLFELNDKLIKGISTLSGTWEGLNGSMSWVVGLLNNSYKPITNTVWVSAQLCKLQKRVHSTCQLFLIQSKRTMIFLFRNLELSMTNLGYEWIIPGVNVLFKFQIWFWFDFWCFNATFSSILDTTIKILCASWHHNTITNPNNDTI